MNIQFRVTKFGKKLSNDLYTWNENTKSFSTNETHLVLEFYGINGVTFKTGYACSFATGHDCSFDTSHSCVFETGSRCMFNVTDACKFDTGSDCVFKAEGACIFEVEERCSLIYNFDAAFQIYTIPPFTKLYHEMDIHNYPVKINKFYM